MSDSADGGVFITHLNDEADTDVNVLGSELISPLSPSRPYTSFSESIASLVDAEADEHEQCTEEDEDEDEDDEDDDEEEDDGSVGTSEVQEKPEQCLAVGDYLAYKDRLEEAAIWFKAGFVNPDLKDMRAFDNFKITARFLSINFDDVIDKNDDDTLKAIILILKRQKEDSIRALDGLVDPPMSSGSLKRSRC